MKVGQNVLVDLTLLDPTFDRWRVCGPLSYGTGR